MDYVWCPLREEPLFNFTDDQLKAAGSSPQLTASHGRLQGFRALAVQTEAEDAGAATTFCIDGREAAEKNPTRFINAAHSKE